MAIIWSAGADVHQVVTATGNYSFTVLTIPAGVATAGLGALAIGAWIEVDNAGGLFSDKSGQTRSISLDMYDAGGTLLLETDIGAPGELSSPFANPFNSSGGSLRVEGSILSGVPMAFNGVVLACLSDTTVPSTAGGSTSILSDVCGAGGETIDSAAYAPTPPYTGPLIPWESFGFVLGATAQSVGSVDLTRDANWVNVLSRFKGWSPCSTYSPGARTPTASPDTVHAYTSGSLPAGASGVLATISSSGSVSMAIKALDSSGALLATSSSISSGQTLRWMFPSGTAALDTVVTDASLASYTVNLSVYCNDDMLGGYNLCVGMGHYIGSQTATRITIDATYPSAASSPSGHVNISALVYRGTLSASSGKRGFAGLIGD